MQMHSRSSRGATLRVQANLFERIIRVAKSYANALGKKLQFLLSLLLAVGLRSHTIMLILYSNANIIPYFSFIFSSLHC
jgi:hypothetical protein